MAMSHHDALPRHVAVIMDGNGRWAVKRGLPRTAGHRQGAERVKEIVRCAQDSGVGVLTLFAFSTENWNRPKREISALMRYLVLFLSRELPGMERNGIRFLTIGAIEALPGFVRAKIAAVKARTAQHTRFTLVLALNYGSRQEIAMACRAACRDAAAGKLCVDDLDEARLAQYLYTAGLPDVDLLIRTSGEIRVSNFMLWQSSYAELYFFQKCWPDFHSQDFKDALTEFAGRRRRFGGLDHDQKAD